MKKRPRLIVHTGPMSGGPPSGAARSVELDGRAHQLVPLAGAVHGELFWKQPAVFRREWQLVSERGEHLLIYARRLNPRRAVAETPAGTWSLSRPWSGSVELADAEGRSLVRVERGWLGRRRVEPASGPSLIWRWHWAGARTLEDGEGYELIRLERAWSFLRHEAVVTLAEAARGREDLLQLLAVTCFTWLGEAHHRAH